MVAIVTNTLTKFNCLKDFTETAKLQCFVCTVSNEVALHAQHVAVNR